MRCIQALLILILACAAHCATQAAEVRVTLIRAAPGNLATILDQARDYRAKHPGQVMLMRHSQGDHWDLMLLESVAGSPIGGPDFRQHADFQHRFLARTESGWDTLAQRAEGAGLFHIEMFHAAAGKLDGLLEQRRMENAYLQATRRQPNALFVTTFGSDVDCFTVGFYRDLAHFAESPDLPAERFEQAARDAGFAARSDIGLYLRRFLVRHQDTLATAVE